MFSPQTVQKEVITNFSENKNKNFESQNVLYDNKMRIILMAIEIERLNKILNSKIDYYNQKMQDYIKRGQNYMQNLELFYKGQIVEYLQENKELNQQILEKNALMSQFIKENSQQEMNKLITQQCLQFEHELKSSQLQNLQLQKENQELRSQFEDAPKLRKKLYDLEQLYSQLLIQKNEEIQQQRQNNQQYSIKNSQLDTLNQIVQYKEQEFLEWQYSSQQTNLIYENKRLKNELKFLNDKLNLLLIDNDHLRVKQEDIQNKNSYQTTFSNKIFSQTKDQTSRRQQKQQINPALNQLFNRPNTPNTQIQPSQIPINLQSLSQPQRDENIYQNINLFNELIEQILYFQNNKIQSKQSIQNQISLLSQLLNLKQSEMSQFHYQKKNHRNYLINQKLLTLPQFVTYPESKKFKKYYSVSPNNINSQPYVISQPHQKSPVNQYHKGIKTETTFISYQNILNQQVTPIVMRPQNIVTYNQNKQQPQIHYHYSPIQKTIVKQNFQNPPYILRGVYPNDAVQFYQPIKINVNQQNLRIFEKQEQKFKEDVYHPEFDVYTTEFQVNSQQHINDQRSQMTNQLNFPNQDVINDKSQQQKSHLDKGLSQNVSYSNEPEQISQNSIEIYQDVQIFNKITLQDPVCISKQRLNSQLQSEDNIIEKDSLNLIYKQFQDFRLIFKQKLQKQEQEFQKSYTNALEQLQSLENQILVLINDKTQQIQNYRDNKFNRTSYEKKVSLDKQQEYQSYKIEQPNSDTKNIDKQSQISETKDFLQQITSQKKFLNQQQIHFIQLISLQEEIQNKYESLVYMLYQKESELNKELVKIKQDKENQQLNLTSKLQVQSEEISELKQQNSVLQQQKLDYIKELKDIQQKLKFEHDQHYITKQVVQSLQLEAGNYLNSTAEIQERNTYLEQQINKTEQLIFEIQTNYKKEQKLNQEKETQTILMEKQQLLQNDQIEIENLKQQLCYEQELSNQLNDSISTLQKQIQTQEQLLQIQKLNNSKQFDEIQNLTKEKIEICQQLKIFQIQNLSLQEQLELIQNQKVVNQNNEQISNIDIIRNLKFEIEDMKQLNQFLSNQVSQIQLNSQTQISAQNTVLSSKIALLEKQLSAEKQLKEQANIRIMQLEKQSHSQQNNLLQDQTFDLKEQIVKLLNQQQLLQQQKENLIESFELELNQLKQKINELTHQNQNFQEQIKDFETKQLLYLQLQKQFANQTYLLNQQQQQIDILQQENNQNQNDLQRLRQNLKLDIQDFQGYQNDQINYLKKQIDEQQRDINYLQSQIQFEQQEKNIIIQNKTILDGVIKQMQEENRKLQNQIQKQQNDIESFSQGYISKEQKNYQNKNEEPKLNIQQLKQENKTLILECQKLKDALQQITEEKNKLEMIFNYQNQVQETQFQEIKQSGSITDKNEQYQQVQQNESQIQQNQIKDLNIKISASLLKLDEFDDLNIRYEQTKQHLLNQIQKSKQYAIDIQQLRTKQIEQDNNKVGIEQKFPSNHFNQKVDELTQIIQVLIICIGDHLQFNSNIVMITQNLKQLLVETNEIIQTIQLQNQILKREGNIQQQENQSPLQTDYEEQCKELIIENDRLNQKANQYQHLLIQLQDEYYKQGYALDSITKEYQQIINKNEFKVIKLIHFEQLNDKIKKQEQQIYGFLEQIQNLQNYFDQEQQKNLEEIRRLNNQIEENQKHMKNHHQINQENIKLKQEISHLQSELQKQNSQEDLIQEQKLIFIQNQEEYTLLKEEAQRLYQRLLQMSNSYNVLKEEKEQDLQRFQRECRQFQQNLEKQKNENSQYKIQLDRLQKSIQEQKNQSDSNLYQELKKVQSKLEASLQQQKSNNDEKKIIQAQVQQQQEQLANQLYTINQLKKEVSKQEQIISQQNNIQSSFVQEVTFFDDSKNASPLEFQVKQLQNENSHLHQLLIDMENDYTHKIKLQQLQIQGLNDKLREMVYEQTKQNPKVDEFSINNHQKL